MTERVVMIGAGQAAIQCIETLRKKGFGGRIDLVGEEIHLPYQRPPLSKKYLAGELAADRLTLRHPNYFDEQRITRHLGCRAVSIDRSASKVTLDDGQTLEYDALVLATGSLPRKLGLPGSDLAGVHSLKDIADADRVRSEIHPGRRAVIIGGGYIGLETAATLRHLGMEVTVLEMADRVMNRVVAEPVSRYFEAEHAGHGTQLLLRCSVTALHGDASGRVCAVETAAGRIEAPLVIVGIGVIANDTLARSAGLACENGIIVDEYCRTSDPVIYAIGDCSNHPSLRYGRRVRLESVDNAFEQGTTAALNILGQTQPHDRVPWFWSDQYHHKLLIIGLSQGHDRVVLRGNPKDHAFSCCYLKNDGELLAIDTVNQAKDQMAARKLIAARAKLDADRAADISIPLKDCVL
ncbi:MAG: pyridine nucleotide-disulfide oxidoreductase [Gammaproteobacteria bacterium]|nr:pyridine nucleotide-disulfide oxidoreductase [Gammaproteobacteria bacterium]